MSKKMFFVIISLMLLLTSCAVNPDTQDSIHYISTEITYSEPTAQYAFKLNMDSTETELAKFFFEPTIEYEE